MTKSAGMTTRLPGESRSTTAVDSAMSVTSLSATLGSGAILREVREAAALLRAEFGVDADVWSVTSINELRRDGLDAERWNLLHPLQSPRVPWVTRMLADASGPVVAATDYVKTHADGLRPFITQRYAVLGTDGFGRSDTRAQLRRFFEVDRQFIALVALKALADDGRFERGKVAEAMTRFGIDPDKPNPANV
jgi:pyruvate dehydrogenase E1 component